jgi:hypothetical protein
MAQSVINQDLYVAGNLSAATFNPPSGSIGNSAIVANAGIDATKLVHQFPLVVQQSPGSAVVAATTLLHIARASATIVSIEAFVATPATGADRTVTIDLQKGSASSAFASVLSSTMQFTNADAARKVKQGTITSASLADNDLLQLVVTVAGSAGAQAQGLCVVVTLRENPQ